jgi:alkylation response protein AidB-like acyl-CoA dehydrogenase
VSFARAEECEILLNSVRTFAKEKLRPNLRAFEANRSVSAAVRTGFDALGLDMLQVPEARGGAGLGMHERVLVNRELAKADAGAALALDRVGAAFFVLDSFGGGEALERFVRPILTSPERRVALVLEDDCTIELTNGHIKAMLPWIPSERADLVVGLGSDRAWAVESGIAFHPLRGGGLRAAGAAELRLDGPLAATWSSRDAAIDALASIRLYIASLLAGVLYDAVEFSRAYGMERVAFGRPVAHHQAMAFLMVDMHTAVERAWLLIEDAACRIDFGEAAHAAAAGAFVEAVEASRFVGPNAVQILGGHGFMADFPMEKAMRESRALGLLAGGVDRAREDASARLLQHLETGS